MSNDIVLTDRPSNLGESVPRLYDIPNCKPYAITKKGEIFNTKTGKKISTYIGIDNYEHCTLYLKGKKYRKRVHRIMGNVFLGSPKVINHKNSVKSDNRLENLEKSTHSKNIQHAYDNNAYESTGAVKLEILNKETGEVIQAKSMREAERITGVDRHRIKTFLKQTRNNWTQWEYKIIK